MWQEPNVRFSLQLLGDSPVDYGVDDDTRVRLICRQDVFHLWPENKYSLLHCRLLDIFLTSMSYINRHGDCNDNLPTSRCSGGLWTWFLPPGRRARRRRTSRRTRRLQWKSGSLEVKSLLQGCGWPGSPPHLLLQVQVGWGPWLGLEWGLLHLERRRTCWCSPRLCTATPESSFPPYKEIFTALEEANNIADFKVSFEINICVLFLSRTCERPMRQTRSLGVSDNPSSACK